MKYRLYFLLIAILLLLPMSVIANVGEPYRVQGVKGNCVFFVLPRMLPKGADTDALRSLQYDITCVAPTDSVSFTATLETNSLYEMKSVTITFPQGEKKTYEIEALYADKKKRKFDLRIRFYLSVSDAILLFGDGLPPYFDFHNSLVYTARNIRAWQKERIAVNDMLRLFQIYYQ